MLIVNIYVENYIIRLLIDTKNTVISHWESS